MRSFQPSGVLGFACVVAWAASSAVAPSAARGAASSASGGSGFSGTLSKNATIRRQQLICDPVAPDAGSTSVSYNPAVSYLTGIADGPGYGPPSSGPGGYIQLQDGMGMRSLYDLGTYLNTISEFGSDYYRSELGLTETGYVQVFFVRNNTPGRLGIASGYDLVQRNPGVTGTDGVDTFALFFDSALPAGQDAVATYTVFAALANTFSDNTADYMQVNGAGGYTVGPTQIAPATVAGPFTPEPASLGLLGAAAAAALGRRRPRPARSAATAS